MKALGLVGGVEYSRDLFEEETIERLMSHYTNVLRGIVEDRERPISELSLLSEAEREQIVVEWNQTERPYPRRSVHPRAVRRAGGADPGADGVDRREGSGELWRAEPASQPTGALPARAGSGAGSGGGIVSGAVGGDGGGDCWERSRPEEPICRWIRSTPLERLGYMLEDAGVGVVLTERELEERLPAFWGQTVCVDEEWERISEESERASRRAGLRRRTWPM